MRPPDLIISTQHGGPQTLRWHLLKWRGFQVALHKWLQDDNDRALHDHSADNISILLWGTYTEHFQKRVPERNQEWCDAHDPVDAIKLENGWHSRAQTAALRIPFIPYFRKAETPHRVALNGRPVWTIWIRFPPRRTWGFHCPKGWRSWQEYLSGDYSTPGSTSTDGRGCD